MPKPKSTTTYQPKWVNEFPWVKSGKPGYAFCVLCSKEILIGSMGRTALASHEKGKKHQANVANTQKSPAITSFMQKTVPSATINRVETVTPTPSTSHATPSISEATPSTSHATPSISEATPSTFDHSLPSMSTIGQVPTTSKPAYSLRERFVIKEKVTAAEILWCIFVVLHHLSLRSAESAYKLFQKMFDDSEVAKDMRLGKEKVSYTIAYGLAPYFESNLRKTIELSKTFVVGFDESLNKVSQTQQMDISIRFWNEITNTVCVRYLTSVFLTKSTAVDLFEALKEGLKGLDMKKILQFSMDGPNVNLKLIRLVKAEMRSNDDDPQFLEIGTCGLHVVNGAFKTGVNKTGWNLLGFFRALYYLFKDSPARRCVFTSITQSTLMPLKFCSVRWLENLSVVKRAQEMLPYLQMYTKKVSGTSDEPSSNSFKIVKETVKDPLILAKLAFFQSLAEELEPFLREYQTNAPMSPFLYSSVSQISTILMTKFVLPDILKTTPLSKIDLFKKADGLFTNLIKVQEIDLGYVTRAALRKCSGISDKAVLNFRKECRTCLQHLVHKIMEKSPISYPFAEHLGFLDPSKIATSTDKSLENMTGALEHVLNSNWLPASTVQNADREYRSLISSEESLNKMRMFSRNETTLDVFWFNILKDQNPQMENLLVVAKMLLPMSHGNAALERGFSINKDIIVENMKNDSLKAQRIVYDSVQEAGGLQDFVVSKELILSCRNANSRWKTALEERKAKQTENERAAVAKRKASMLAKELEEKKKKMKEDMDRSLAALDEEIKKAKCAINE